MATQVALTANIFILQMIFAFAILGSQLTGKVAEVNELIYDCDWYNYPPKIQMLTIMIMKRAQKPFIMKGYALTACSLESAKNVSLFDKVEVLLNLICISSNFRC